MVADRPNRVMVYGVTGSGKSTLARLIAERTGLAPFYIDDLTWRPGWVPVPADEQRAIVADICCGDRWVIDHGYGSWLDITMARTDLIVGLDYPRWLSLARLSRRCLVNVITKRPLCNGNIETWRHLVGKESILLWHFRSFARKRRRMRSWATEQKAPCTVLFTRPRQAAAWLETLSAG
ncbi:MAG: adenylate kinase [Nakamurella sp.]